MNVDTNELIQHCSYFIHSYCFTKALILSQYF